MCVSVYLRGAWGRPLKFSSKSEENWHQAEKRGRNQSRLVKVCFVVRTGKGGNVDYHFITLCLIKMQIFDKKDYWKDWLIEKRVLFSVWESAFATTTHDMSIWKNPMISSRNSCKQNHLYMRWNGIKFKFFKIFRWNVNKVFSPYSVSS